MPIVSFSDYWFSFKRGPLLDNLKTIIIYFFKSFVLNLYAIRFLLIRKRILQLDEIRKIAIYIPATAGMGDLIMSQLFFRDLRERLPNAEIILYTRFQKIIQKHYINDVINIHNLKFREQLNKLNQNNFDLICFPEKSFIGSRLFVNVKCKFKLGYLNTYRIKSNFYHNEDIVFLPNQHHYFLKSYFLFKYLFGKTDKTHKYLPDLSSWDLINKPVKTNYIVVVSKVQWENRSISNETLILVIQEILHSKYDIVLAGGDESKNANQILLSHFSNFGNRIIYNPSMPLEDFASLIKNSKGVICGDSGPMHLAFGFKRPVLSFWGPTFPNLRVPDSEIVKHIAVFEKDKCNVNNCYNMEFKPFCKSCLRLENISSVNSIVNNFLKML